MPGVKNKTRVESNMTQGIGAKVPLNGPIAANAVITASATAASNHRSCIRRLDRKSTRLNSSHTVIYTLSLHDALPISRYRRKGTPERTDSGECRDHRERDGGLEPSKLYPTFRSEEHTSELQSHSDLHSFPTRRSSDLKVSAQRYP